MRFKDIFSISLTFCLLFLCSCSKDDTDNEDIDNGNGNGVEIPEDFETNSQNIEIENAITIHFHSSGEVDINNPYENSVNILTEEGNVIITSNITDTELNYVLSGVSNNGSVKIYSSYKFGLVLNGVSLTSTNGAAINIQSSKKVSVSLIENTNNRLIDSSVYPESGTEDMKAALFSEGQLIFNGNGSLLVYGQNKHAICSDDYIRINEGNIKVVTAAKDGIHSNDYFEMNGGTLDISSTSDAIECESGYIVINNGNITLKSSDGDAIKTSYKGTDTSIVPDITITGGEINILVEGLAAKGVTAKGNILISGGNINITSKGDAYYDTEEADTSSSSGIKAKGNMTLSNDAIITIVSTGKGGKGINIDGNLTFDGGTTTVTTTGEQYVYDKNNDTASKAIKSDGYLTINSGAISIKTSTTEAEGLESKSTLTINGGSIEIEAYDDGINASNHIEITGGTVYSYSTTNDAIDSNGTLTISGGTIVAIGSSQPEVAFDCDNNTFKITGGTLVGIAGSTSTPTSSVCTQRSLVYGKSGSFQLIHIESAAGEDILTFKLPRTYSQTVLLFSSSKLKASTSHTIYLGGTVSGGKEFHGIYENATYTKGSSDSSFTTSSMVTSVGTTGGNPGGGGRP